MPGHMTESEPTTSSWRSWVTAADERGRAPAPPEPGSAPGRSDAPILPRLAEEIRDLADQIARLAGTVERLDSSDLDGVREEVRTSTSAIGEWFDRRGREDVTRHVEL